MRNTPDMSLNADPYTGYYIYCSTFGGWIPNVGGTSAVAPQLAAFWSMVSKGLGSRPGFANPILYAIGRNSTLYSSGFHTAASGIAVNYASGEAAGAHLTCAYNRRVSGSKFAGSARDSGTRGMAPYGEDEYHRLK